MVAFLAALPAVAGAAGALKGAVPGAGAGPRLNKSNAVLDGLTEIDLTFSTGQFSVGNEAVQPQTAIQSATPLVLISALALVGLAWARRSR